MIWIALLFCLFIWWFSTGAILYVVSRAHRKGWGYGLVVLAALPFLTGGIYAVMISTEAVTMPLVYTGFLGALSIWGFLELAFLAGIVTGPNRSPLRPGSQPLERVQQAFAAIAYHELALFAALVAVWAMSWDQPNTLAAWTFTVLFFARISAKVNVFLGVPNINEEFLPKPVEYLISYFRKAQVTAFYPIAVTFLILMTGCWIERVVATEGAMSVGFALLATLSALAVIEHWLMVMAVPDAALWTWLMPKDRHGARKSRLETVGGKT